MPTSEIKLCAKRKITGRYLKYCAVSFFPFFVFVSLLVINYYLFTLLKNTDFNISIRNYDVDTIFSISVFEIFLSFSYFIWRSGYLIKENFFRLSTRKSTPSFIKCIRTISLKQYLRYTAVSTITFLLKVSWSTIFFLPCLSVSALLIYSYRYENYGFNVNLALFVSALLLFITGVLFLFVILKRYALCSQIILNNEEKNPLKIIEQSIARMENRCVAYSLYCLSFAGWAICCVFLLPVFYVLPYVNTGRWYYLNSIRKSRFFKHTSEKPIIFYFSTNIKKVGN